MTQCIVEGCTTSCETYNGAEYRECGTHRGRMKRYGSYELWLQCKECGQPYETSGTRFHYCPTCLEVYLQCTRPNITTGKGRNLIHWRYGLTPFQFYRIWVSQDGKCKLCGLLGKLPFEWTKSTKLNVDHDHSCCSGKKSCGSCIRGLLCDSCNLILGHYEARKSLGHLRIEQFDKYLLERVVF